VPALGCAPPRASTSASTNTGQPVAGKYEVTYRDATGRQVWQTASGDTKTDAKNERDELVARMHKGECVERTNLTVAEVAQLWLERGTGPKGRWSRSTHERYECVVRNHINASAEERQRPIKLQAARAERRSRRRLIAFERARARTHHGADRADRPQPESHAGHQ
jgi:hypothetical protein